MSWFDLIKDDEEIVEGIENMLRDILASFGVRIEDDEPETYIENEQLARIMAKYLVLLRLKDEEVESKGKIPGPTFSAYYPELTYEALTVIDDMIDELKAANLLDTYNASYDGIIPDVHTLVNRIINKVTGTEMGASYIYANPKDDIDINKSNWFTTIKGVETATRSAELWAQNDEELYSDVIQFIEDEIRGTHNTIETVTESLGQFLSERMAMNDGFMSELTEGNPSDGLVDVDWREVAELFSEDISEAMEAYR